MTTRFKLLISAIFLTAFSTPSIAGYEPKAKEEAIVICGNARFTVLTDRLVRMEYSGKGKFEDEATLAIVNRRLEVPAFKCSRSGKKGVVIETAKICLTYSGEGVFSKDNLSVSFEMPGKDGVITRAIWHPGDDPSGNLLGTSRTLDKCDSKQSVLDKGEMSRSVISRDGWAVIDETSRHLIRDDKSSWGGWVEERKADAKRQDLYLFAYGHDYLDAIRDYTLVAGKVPLPPKFAFGFWQSRYWTYSDYEFINIASKMRSEGIPADVMIIDMDWHYTYGHSFAPDAAKDDFKQNVGWTGYTWNHELFPDPAATLKELHGLNFKTSLNLHPASGIQPQEECYENFVKDYLSRTKTYDGPKGFIYGAKGHTFVGNDKASGVKGEKAPVPFRISDRHWTEAYFNSVIHPLEKDGVDFWWLDWQQWRKSKYVKDLDLTFWLNYSFFQDKVRQSRSLGEYASRPMIYHRWGGLGSHRYQIGFSGDTYISWTTLGMLPWFTATASNVCYGYWGHDLGGHMLPKKGDFKIGHNPEIFTRWLQFGVFTPIFKIHSTKDPRIERYIWNYPTHTDILKQAVRLRYSLSRYIYDAARECYDTGISICRPLYYYAPEDEQSYSFEKEYYFGNDIIAAPVCSPADQNGISEVKIWLPKGSKWYDMTSGRLFEGGQELSLKYAIHETPWFVRSGAIIPLAGKNINSLQEKSNELRVFVAPGDGQAEYTTYEDDGCTQAYEKEFATTKITKRSDASSLVLVVSPRKGAYRDMEPTRKVSAILEGVYAPEKVILNGTEIAYSRFSETSSEPVWSYDGKTLATVISLPESDASQEIRIECKFDASKDRNVLRGFKGLCGRLHYLTDSVKRLVPDATPEFNAVAGASSRISTHPEKTQEILQGIDINAMNSAWAKNKRFPYEFGEKMKALTN